MRSLCTREMIVSHNSVLSFPMTEFYKKMEVCYEKYMQVGNLVSLENDLDVKSQNCYKNKQ